MGELTLELHQLMNSQLTCARQKLLISKKLANRIPACFIYKKNKLVIFRKYNIVEIHTRGGSLVRKY
jgi:hypothetical protein